MWGRAVQDGPVPPGAAARYAFRAAGDSALSGVRRTSKANVADRPRRWGTRLMATFALVWLVGAAVALAYAAVAQDVDFWDD